MRPFTHLVPSAYTLWTRLLRLWDRLSELTHRTRPTNPRLRLEALALEDRVVPAPLIPYPVIFAGAGSGSPVVRSYDAQTGALNFERSVFEPAFTGGVRVATADFTGDGYPDAVVAAGDGGGPRVRVLDGKTGDPLPGPLGDLMAFDDAFRGGVNVAAGDIDGDGTPDAIAAAGAGGGPHVVAFSGTDGSLLASFYALDPGFAGGVSVGAADFTGDGRAEVVIGAGEGGGPRVTVADAMTGQPIDGPLGNFFAFDPLFRGGVTVGTDSLAGDVTGDTIPDIITGSGLGMGSKVRVFDGRTGELASEFSPFGSDDTSGVRVAVAYIDDDRRSDLVTGTGPGVAARVRTFSGATGRLMPGPVGDFLPFGDSAQGGVFVAASNDPLNPSLTWSSVDPGSTVVGQAVELTVGMTGQNVSRIDYIPTGEVTFSAIDTTTSATYTLGTATVVTVNPTLLTVEATLVARSLPAGTYTLRAFYPGNGDFPNSFQSATVDYGTSFTVSATASNVPSDQPPDPSCGCGDQLESSSTATDAKRRPLSSASGVKYGSGSVAAGKPAGSSSGGFGTWWGTDAGWTSASGYSDLVNGNGFAQCAAPHVIQVNSNDSLAVVSNASTARFFDKYDGSYHARYGEAATAVHDSGNGEFEVTDGAGNVYTFYDFSGGTPSGRTGKLKSIADAAGNLTSVTAYDSTGAIGEVQRVSGSGGSALTESFVYAYIASGANAGLLESVTQRTRVGTGSWTTVRTEEYAYYTTGSGVPGRTGDLKTAIVKDGSGNTIDTSYYRYYTSSGSGGGSGSKHLMKFAFDGDDYVRLQALATSLSTTMDALSDAQVDDHASKYMEYDSSDRVSEVVDAAAGCSACAGGLGEFTYSYSTNSSWDGSRLTNVWSNKTVEVLPDGNTNTLYTNPFGQVMLRVYEDTTTSQEWRWFTRYDDDGRVILEAGPSAVSGHSESNVDLVGYSSGNASYLEDSTGLVTTYTLATSTTATSSVAGDAAGYLKETALRRGETGTSIPQLTLAYIKRTAGGVDQFFPASSTVYRNDNGTGGQTTTMSYTWQGSTAQSESVTVTLPTVTTAQNGPNSPTSMTTVFDTYGRPVWSKDAGGFLSYTEYDVVTGGVTKQITDVEDSETGDFTALPSGWTTPSGGGLHLITTYEVDNQGRPTKVTHPDGRIDYTVYDDDGHEVRSYQGWDETTDRPTGPTVVMREDRAGNFTETLTMTAAPSVSGDRPTGGEAISQLQSLSREYRNDAGQVIYRDAYFDLGGLTYSTSTSLGAEGTNFYRTEQAYNRQGLPNKTVSGENTIYRTEYDGLGRVVSEWVGTDDTPTSGFWSPSNLTGTDMVKVIEYEYDGGGVGDGNLTKVTAHPGLSQPDRVTETYYDWRNRPVAVKAGVEGSESTSVNRPITYADYDNLGQVTKVRMYDGDGVSITSTGGVPNAPSSSLLRAQTTTSSDELGRAYRQDTYSVDPSSGSVGSNTLYSLTWYDARGQVIKTLSPGGLIQKQSYDGTGRVTTTYLTDGGGDSGYADADDVSGDTVLEQIEYAYDKSGNVIQTTGRQRFHDGSGTGAIGSPSSGIGARVSYSGSFYDKAHRPIASVSVGTNGGTSWTRPSSVPSRSDTVLVTSAEYAADAVQTVWLTGSPTGGTFTLTVGGYITSGIAYNASAATVDSALEALTSIGSGNVVVTAAAGGGWQVRFAGSLAGVWQAQMTASGAGLTGGTSPSVAVSTVSLGGDAGAATAMTDPKGLVTRTYRDALGRVTQTVGNFVDGAVSDADDKTTALAYNSVGMTNLTAVLTGGVQTTQWVYGITQTGSGITSNDVVGATRWPDPSTGAASSSEQEPVTVNALGQTVTSTDRNGSVHTLSYDVLGRVVSDAVTTLGSGVNGSVRRIEVAYDGQGNSYLVTSYDAASSGSVVNQAQRAYNGLGQLTAEYQSHSGTVNPSTTPKVQYVYSEMPSGTNHSRLTNITYPSGYVLTSNYSSGLDNDISRLSSLTDSTGTVEAYSYLGLGTVVIRSHPQPEIDLTYVKQGMESNGDAGDPYTGLDRFGRVVDQRWIDTGSGTATDRFQYGYDRNGNRTYRDNLVNTAFGELYTYDGFNQLVSFDRGTLNGTKDGITGTVARSQDWDYDALGNWDSVTTDSSTQTRSANTQNEITSISGATTPAYDANGNMTGDETGKTFVYDAWNRLVAVKSGSTTLETFAYEGRNRRVTNTVGSTTTELYYSVAWQVVEEKVGSNTTARYVWSPVYIDAMALRDRDTDTNGTLDERLWVQHDANWNVTAVVDGTGNVVERYAYDPFGIGTMYDVGYNVRSAGSSYAWVYLHQGGRVDPISGTTVFRHRDLRSTLGRWMSLDPIQFFSGDTNHYLYVGNNPVTFLDSSGLFKGPILPPFFFLVGTEPNSTTSLYRLFLFGDPKYFSAGYMGELDRYLRTLIAKLNEAIKLLEGPFDPKFRFTDFGCCLYLWFGANLSQVGQADLDAHLDTIRRKVLEVLLKVRDGLSSTTVVMTFTDQVPLIYGWVVRDPVTGAPLVLNLTATAGPPRPGEPITDFWSLMLDERIGTLFHELTHWFANTRDHAYLTPPYNNTNSYYNLNRYGIPFPVSLDSNQRVTNADTFQHWLTKCLLRQK